MAEDYTFDHLSKMTVGELISVRVAWDELDSHRTYPAREYSKELMDDLMEFLKTWQPTWRKEKVGAE